MRKKFLSGDRRLYLHARNRALRSDVDRLTLTKQLLNSVCIGYFYTYILKETDMNKKPHRGTQQNYRIGTVKNYSPGAYPVSTVVFWFIIITVNSLYSQK